MHIINRLDLHIINRLDFPGGSGVKNLPANTRDTGLILGSGRSAAGGKRFLAWEISWTGEPGRLQSMGLQKSQIRFSN